MIPDVAVLAQKSLLSARFLNKMTKTNRSSNTHREAANEVRNTVLHGQTRSVPGTGKTIQVHVR